MTEQEILTKHEDTLYILENLASTENADLDHAEIDVYYEFSDGSEGAAQFDMPTIACRAIETIKDQQKHIAELKAFIRRERYNIKQNEGDATQRTIDKLLDGGK